MAKKIVIVVALVVAVAVVIVQKRARPSPDGTSAGPAQATSQPDVPLPRMVEVGMGKCLACKRMKPIMAELERDYAGRLRVDVIDLNTEPAAEQRYGITIIPAQIFFDPSGEELHRHTGFMSKDDILAKWSELGFDLDRPTTQASAG
jgi:thioredoxin 1